MKNYSKLLFLLMMFLFLTNNIFSQQITFSKVYNFDTTSVAYSVLQTLDTGYIVAGKINKKNGEVWILKLNKYGDTLWTKTYGDSLADYANEIQNTSDGGYIVAGGKNHKVDMVNYYMYGDIWILKLDQNGDTLWTKTYGGPYNDDANSIKQNSDGGYIVLGTYLGDGSLIIGVLTLIRTDSLGNILWRKDAAEYGLICSWGMNLEITNDKGFIITGYTNPCNTNANPFLLKTDFSGNQQWVQIYDSLQTNPMFEPSAQGYDVIQTGDGGYLLTGIAGSFAVDGEIFILKTDSIGNKLWLMKDTGILIATGSSISKAENENYIILGTTTDSISGNGNKYMYLLKIDSIGNKIWGKTYDWNTNNTSGAVVRMDQQENYLLLGTRDSTWDAKEIIFIKTDTNGNILWEKSFKKYNRTYGMDLDISTDLGYIILGAYNNLNDNEDGIYLIKTDSAGSIQWERLIANRGGYSIRQTFDDGYIITGVPSTLLIKTNDTGGVVLNINLSPIEKTSSINVYPNPVINDGFYVSFQTVERSLIIIKLYDYTGKDVCFIRNENQPQGFYKKYIPTNNLPSGLYFLTVTINEKVYSNKIIIF